MGNAKQPTIKSAAAKLATKKLNGERRLWLGSMIIAKRTSTFPVIAVSESTLHRDADVILSSVGADTFVHGYSPINDITSAADKAIDTPLRK